MPAQRLMVFVHSLKEAPVSAECVITPGPKNRPLALLPPCLKVSVASALSEVEKEVKETKLGQTVGHVLVAGVGELRSPTSVRLA